MKLSDYKKYISWNLISIIGYVCIVITAIFLVMLMIASSGTTIRPDINEYFYDYTVKHLIIPYIGFYRFQLFLVGLCMLLSIAEHKYNKYNNNEGLMLFESHEKEYSIVFVVGITMNFVPLNIFFMLIILWIMRFI